MKKYIIMLLALALMLMPACTKKKLEETSPANAGSVTAQFVVDVEHEGDEWRYALADDGMVEVLTTPEETGEEGVLPGMRFWITGKAAGETVLTLECTDSDGKVVKTLDYQILVADDLTVTVRSPEDENADQAEEKTDQTKSATISLLYDASVVGYSWSYAMADESLASVQVTAEADTASNTQKINVRYKLSGVQPGETTFTLCCMDQVGTVVESRPYLVLVGDDLAVQAFTQVSFMSAVAEDGFVWDYELEDAGLVALERSAEAAGEVGTFLPVTYTFRGLEPGETVLTFRCTRSWAPMQVANLRKYKISVNNDLLVTAEPMDLQMASLSLPETKGSWMVASAGENAFITLNQGSCSFFARQAGESRFLLISLNEDETEVLDMVRFRVSVKADGSVLAEEIK